MEPVHIALDAGADLDGFRTAVRRLIAQDVPPDRVIWSGAGCGEMFGAAPDPAETPGPLCRAASPIS